MTLSISYLNIVFQLRMNDKTSFTLKCRQNELGDAPAASPNPLYLRSEFAIFDLTLYLNRISFSPYFSSTLTLSWPAVSLSLPYSWNKFATFSASVLFMYYFLSYQDTINKLWLSTKRKKIMVSKSGFS